MMVLRAILAASFAFVTLSCSLETPPLAEPGVASTPSPRVPAAGSPADVAPDAEVVANGRIEHFEDLRIVRVWGDPRQRGRALGELLGAEIVRLMRAEYDDRFARHPQLIAQVRATLSRMIAYPEPMRAQLAAMWEVIERTVPERDLPKLRRPLDFDDLLIANALDVFGTMGCSGFTVWDREVEGGGVLTARNFDWRVTGPHLVDDTIVLVEHPSSGKATASITWPGYLGAVTAVNERGVAVFLHVGNGKKTMRPEPESWPTAAAARRILERASAQDAGEIAAELLQNTSPPASYITRVVLPVTGGSVPSRVFEADFRSVSERPVEAACVVTNHFIGRAGVRRGRDSTRRFETLTAGLRDHAAEGDHQLSASEAWDVLAAVERGGAGFATLHSLVFRADPWVFELAIGRVAGDGAVRAAPSQGRRYRIPREVLFRAPGPSGR